MSETLLPIGTTLRSVYVIEEQLASGGFGNTYKARNTQFNEHYAIKEFFISGINEREADHHTVSVSNETNRVQYDEQLAKFKKEAQRLRRLKNDHIVQVHDLFEENGTCYYAMDFIDGESLAARLKSQGSISEQEVLHLLPQVLDALKTVHAAELYHLDLKPANIMLTRGEQVKLIDFGASKQLNADGNGATSSTSLCYTPGFAPPEQVEQNLDKFGPWTDLFALGATIFNLLTNKKPPVSSDISENPDTAFAPLLSVCSRQMQTYVHWLMQPKRNLRPQSVDEAIARMKVLFKLTEQQPKSVTPNPISTETKLAEPAPKPQPAPQPKPAPKPQPAPQPKPAPKPQPAPQPKPVYHPMTPKKKSSAMPFIVIGGILTVVLLVGAGIAWMIFSQEETTAFNDHKLNSELDTLAYSMGMAQSEGLADYLANQYDMDTTQMMPFCEGVLYAVDMTDIKDYQQDHLKTAFNIGIEIGQQIKDQMLPAIQDAVFADSTQTVPTDKLMAGFVQALQPGTALMSMDQAKETSTRLIGIYQERKAEAVYADNKRQGEDFLNKKRREQGVYELPRSGGVLYKVIKSGSGLTPTPESTIRVRYEGRLADGTIFDTNWNKRRGTEINLAEAIKGWQSALPRMTTGSVWEIYIPYRQAYGVQEKGDIKPFSALAYKIELLEVK